ncbi:MAG: hypothetical protein AAGJ81_11850 [Verrucomicrobiota bacterium]
MKRVLTGPVILGLLFAFIGWTWSGIWTGWTRWDVTLSAENGGVLKWYVDSGKGFSEDEGANTGVPASERFTASVLLPSSLPKSIRLDPLDRDGVIIIESISWREPWLGRSGTLAPEDANWSGVARGSSTDYGFRIEVAEGDMDPFGVWEGYDGSAPAWWLLLRMVSALLLGFIAFALGLLWNRAVKARI